MIFGKTELNNFDTKKIIQKHGSMGMSLYYSTKTQFLKYPKVVYTMLEHIRARLTMVSAEMNHTLK